jgi:cytochrome c-type biogenesis protein CcmH
MRRVLVSVAALACLCAPAFGQTTQVDTDLKAREIGRQLRCVVCQNESIEASNAPLANDMRQLVRERVEAGDTEADILAMMRDRYGDYVLLKPPVQSNTAVLWAAPLLLGLGAFGWWVASTRRGGEDADAAPLTDAEEARFAALRDASDGT